MGRMGGGHRGAGPYLLVEPSRLHLELSEAIGGAVHVELDRAADIIAEQDKIICTGLGFRRLDVRGAELTGQTRLLRCHHRRLTLRNWPLWRTFATMSNLG